MAAPVYATAIGIGGVLLGLWLTAARQRARGVIPFSAGVLLGVALFVLFPELVHDVGWARGAALVTGGYLVLFLVNRYAYPVCPTCSHDHDHNSCATELHGFAAPLVIAAAVHSFLDGWSISTAEHALTAEVRLAIPVAVALHKLPEGVALGAIIRAAVRTRAAAFGWCALAEGTTLVGGSVGLLLVPYLGAGWISYPLGVAGGLFVFLATHAVHEEWKRRGAAPAVWPALTGTAGAAVLQRGVEALFR
ncbi:MAG: ZIP family metal transporter [Bryobacteraceae bacterium]